LVKFIHQTLDELCGFFVFTPTPSVSIESLDGFFNVFGVGIGFFSGVDKRLFYIPFLL